MTMVDRDEEHLRLLSILYYVWGGLIACLSCLGVVYSLVGGGIMVAASQQQAGPPVWFGGLFFVLGIAMVLFVGTVSALTIWTGRNLQLRRRHTFCLVIAAISCLSVPFGTALGVFTIIVLQRPSVKQLFDQSAAA